jgi:glutaredoxin
MNAQSLAKKTQKQEKIIVYGSDTCHYCIDTKAYLKEKNINFIYYDIDLNKAKETEMITKLTNASISVASLSLPVIDYKGDIFLNKGNFEEFLKVIQTKIK